MAIGRLMDINAQGKRQMDTNISGVHISGLTYGLMNCTEPMGTECCERVWMKEMFVAVGNSARCTYTCTSPLVHTGIHLGLHVCALVHMASHRCAQMFHICLE